MESYVVVPKRQNMFNITFIAACGGGAAVVCGYSLIKSIMDSTYKFTLADKLAAVILFVLCVYGVTWQFKGRLVYAISGDGRADGGADLVITRGKGQNPEVFCRIGLEQITAVIPLITKPTPRVEKSDKETRRLISEMSAGKRKYRYCPDMIPTDVMVVFTGEHAITLSFDEKFYFALRENSGAAQSDVQKKHDDRNKRKKSR